MKVAIQLVAFCLILAVAVALFGAQTADASYGCYGYGYSCYTPYYHNYCAPVYTYTPCYTPCYTPFYRCW